MTKDSAPLALELAERVRRMVNNANTDQDVADAIRLSWFVRTREKEAVVDTLSGMAIFAQRENVTFNADAIVAEATYMAKEMMKP